MNRSASSSAVAVRTSSFGSCKTSGRHSECLNSKSFPNSSATYSRAGSVPVVVPHPVGQIVIGIGLVAALWREVENNVSAQQLFGPARVGRIAVEDVAGLILVKHADAGELVDRGIRRSVIVVDLALSKFLFCERDVVIEVEVAT
jgi:hypothetical protein